jgi:hypothetical protein
VLGGSLSNGVGRPQIARGGEAIHMKGICKHTTMDTPREVAKSGLAGRGNFTLHSISKTSVHLPAL